jgi:hypothetical protein
LIRYEAPKELAETVVGSYGRWSGEFQDMCNGLGMMEMLFDSDDSQQTSSCSDVTSFAGQ